MIVYRSISDCIQSQTTIEAKIEKIDAIITALEDTVLKAVGNGDVQEYSLNDGQTVIKTVYRDTIAVIKSIKELEAVRQMYINRLTGHVIRLVDGKNFSKRNGTR